MSTLAALEAKVDAAIIRLDGHLRECAETNRTKEAESRRLAQKIENIEQLPMKAVRWIGTLIVAAAVTQLVTVYMTNHEAAVKAAEAAQAAQQAALVSKGQGATISRKLDTVIEQQANATCGQNC